MTFERRRIPLIVPPVAAPAKRPVVQRDETAEPGKLIVATTNSSLTTIVRLALMGMDIRIRPDAIMAETYAQVLSALEQDNRRTEKTDGIGSPSTYGISSLLLDTGMRGISEVLDEHITTVGRSLDSLRGLVRQRAALVVVHPDKWNEYRTKMMGFLRQTNAALIRRGDEQFPETVADWVQHVGGNLSTLRAESALRERDAK